MLYLTGLLYGAQQAAAGIASPLATLPLITVNGRPIPLLGTVDPAGRIHYGPAPTSGCTTAMASCMSTELICPTYSKNNCPTSPTSPAPTPPTPTTPPRSEVLLVLQEICHILEIPHYEMVSIFGKRTTTLRTWGKNNGTAGSVRGPRRVWIWWPNAPRSVLCRIDDGTIARTGAADSDRAT